MNQEADTDYYVARLRAERGAAAAATSEEARDVHHRLALRYAELLAARGHPAAIEGLEPAASGVPNAVANPGT